MHHVLLAPWLLLLHALLTVSCAANTQARNVAMAVMSEPVSVSARKCELVSIITALYKHVGCNTSAILHCGEPVQNIDHSAAHWMQSMLSYSLAAAGPNSPGFGHTASVRETQPPWHCVGGLGKPSNGRDKWRVLFVGQKRNKSAKVRLHTASLAPRVTLRVARPVKHAQSCEAGRAFSNVCFGHGACV